MDRGSYMTINDILISNIITIEAGQTLSLAMQLLLDHRISCLPVIEGEDTLIGIISDKDIFRKVHETDGKYQAVTVGEAMTTDLIIGLPTDKVSYIARIMTENRIRHVPVCKDARIIGLVSIGDIVKTQIDDIEGENRYLKQYIKGEYPG